MWMVSLLGGRKREVKEAVIRADGGFHSPINPRGTLHPVTPRNTRSPLNHDMNRNFALHLHEYSASGVDTQKQTVMSRNMARFHMDKHNAMILSGFCVLCAVRVLMKKVFMNEDVLNLSYGLRVSKQFSTEHIIQTYHEQMTIIQQIELKLWFGVRLKTRQARYVSTSQ